jgi:uncharacterized phage protein (TIGR02218 family)
MVRFMSVAVVMGLALVAGGCEQAKSANPLSPSIAGPIPGVNISAPSLLEPAQNASIVQSGDSTQDEFKITTPLSLAVVQSYLNNAPATRLNVRVRRHHDGEATAVVVWVGTLDRVKAINEAAAELVCRSALASIEGGGMRLAWARTCTHMLYDSQCGASRTTFRRVATVTAISGSVVTGTGLAGTPAGALRGGYLEWTTAAGFAERQAIMADADGSVTLLGPATGLTVGMSVNAYFGCARTAEVCNGTFANLSNYGGFPHIPSRSPFDGDPVF